MKLIVITGPSGSGKTYLSNKLAKSFNNTIIINTDSYYRDSFLIKFLSKFSTDIYDRPFTIRKKELITTISSIIKKEEYTKYYKYDFKRKLSTNSKKSNKFINKTKLLIIEGIFSHRLDLDYTNTINILCKETKDICYERRVKRDKKERNRNKNEVTRRFFKSWDIYHRNLNNYIEKNKVICLNKWDLNTYEKLIDKIKNEIKNQGK